MNEISDGCPVFPQSYRVPGHSTTVGVSGLTLRVHAAIALRHPSSGISWLDGMIRESLRDHFAGQIISGFAGSSRGVGCFDIAASDAYQLADAMLAAREVQR